ncbi:MAG: tripartite tricarboxylate transporter permease [Pseudomonadota bacterium]
MNIPGEAASVVTCLDGYQMARKGRAGTRHFGFWIIYCCELGDHSYHDFNGHDNGQDSIYLWDHRTPGWNRIDPAGNGFIWYW